MATDTVEYEYIGPAAWFVDVHAGSGMVWESKGSVQAVPAVFAARFEEIYVDCEGAQLRRITPKGDVAKGDPDDIGAIPSGSLYSGLSAAQMKKIYTEKTGKTPVKGLKAVDMMKEIQIADLDAELARVPIDTF